MPAKSAEVIVDSYSNACHSAMWFYFMWGSAQILAHVTVYVHWPCDDSYLFVAKETHS